MKRYFVYIDPNTGEEHEINTEGVTDATLENLRNNKAEGEARK